MTTQRQRRHKYYKEFHLETSAEKWGRYYFRLHDVMARILTIATLTKRTGETNEATREI